MNSTQKAVFSLHNILSFLIKSCVVFVLILSVLSCAALFSYSYTFITHQLLAFYGKLDKLDEFRTSFLTPNRFLLAQGASIISSILGVVFLIRLSKTTHWLLTKLLSFIASIKAFIVFLTYPYSLLSKREKLIFLLLIVQITSLKLYFLPKYFFHIDELTSYLYFIKRGFLVSASYYPNPNNHILYSLLVGCFKPFISDPVYLMKLPTFFISILFSIFIFLFSLRYFSFLMTCLGTLIFSLAGHIFNYSLFGRGYLLMTFFVMLSSVVVYEICLGNKSKMYWHIYILATILGCYSMVIYVYPAISLSLLLGMYWLVKRPVGFGKLFIYAHLYSLVGCVFLYTPVFIVSGLEAITSNSWIVKPGLWVVIKELPLYVEQAFRHIFDISGYATCFALAIFSVSGCCLVLKKKWAALSLFSIFYVLPLILIVVQQIRPYDRIWTYLIFPTSILLVISINGIVSFAIFSERLKTGIVSFLMLVVIGYTFINSMLNFSPTRTLIYYDVGRITKSIVAESSGVIYTNENTYNLYLRFQYDQLGKRKVPEMNLSNRVYDYLVLVPGTNPWKTLTRADYLLAEKNDYIEIYKRKSL